MFPGRPAANPGPRTADGSGVALPRAERSPEMPVEIPGLTGGRGLACAGVVVGHVVAFTAPHSPAARALAPLANSCVTFFFALSGFLLGRPFLAAIAGTAVRPQLRRYARQRVLRIFPGYLAIFLVSDFLLRAVYVANATLTQRPRTDAGTGTITAPVRLLQQLTLTHDFAPGQLQTGINPSWSITTELCFYAVLPVLGAAGLALVRRGVPPLRAALRLPLLLVAFGLIAKGVDAMGQVRSGMDIGQAQFGATWLAVFSRSLLVYADAFGWGMAAALLYSWPRSRRDGPDRVRRSALIAPAAVLVAALVGGFGWAVADDHYESAQAAFALTAGAILVAATHRTTTGRAPWIGRAMDWRPFHFLGRISYSLYLLHYPVLIVTTRAGWIGNTSPTGLVRSLVVVFVVAVAGSTLTYELIERPALRWGARGAARTSAPPAAPVGAPVGAPVAPVPPQPLPL